MINRFISLSRQLHITVHKIPCSITKKKGFFHCDLNQKWPCYQTSSALSNLCPLRIRPYLNAVASSYFRWCRASVTRDLWQRPHTPQTQKSGRLSIVSDSARSFQLRASCHLLHCTNTLSTGMPYSSMPGSFKCLAFLVHNTDTIVCRYSLTGSRGRSIVIKVHLGKVKLYARRCLRVSCCFVQKRFGDFINFPVHGANSSSDKCWAGKDMGLCSTATTTAACDSVCKRVIAVLALF